MNLSWFEWLFMAIAVVALRLLALRTGRYMKGVADFLSANRCAGRYLLTVSSSMGNTGAISVVAMFELYYLAGFPPIWWNIMLLAIPPIALLTGWIYYRFRETRALTMAQFFEMRYSRRFRIYAGLICWLSGILNFGIFPAVAARFFIYFCGLPPNILIPGLGFTVPTMAVVMLVDLAIAILLVTNGGQISVMITECAQGIFCGVGFIIVAGAVFLMVGWPEIVQSLHAAPAHASMFNPFDTGQAKDINFWYYLIMFISCFYGYMNWQGSQAFNSSGRSPHEQKMGGIIAAWRELPKQLMILVLPLAAFAVMHLARFAPDAALINESLSKIGSETIRGQMQVPVILAHLLPVGVKGLLATIMLFFSFTCHDTYMHSWGSIFAQDVYMPIRNKPLRPEQHIRLLRWSIIGVGAFAFLFSMLYQQSQMIVMYFAITGAIWLAGSGIVIIGGLYWRRGTTPAAYCALTVGLVSGLGGLFVVPQVYQSLYHRPFPINEQWMLLIGMVVASLVYVVVSLLTCRKGQEFDLTQMLGRDRSEAAYRPSEPGAVRSRLCQLVGFTSEFSKGDKVLAVALLVWNFGWVALFLAVAAVNLVYPIGTEWWVKFWRFYIVQLFVISVPTTIWLTYGALSDVRSLFKTLETVVRDPSDDGRVSHQDGSLHRDEKSEVELVK